MCYKVCYLQKENPVKPLISSGLSVVRVTGLESGISHYAQFREIQKMALQCGFIVDGSCEILFFSACFEKNKHQTNTKSLFSGKKKKPKIQRLCGLLAFSSWWR